jgi:hypothetical protein
MINDNVFLEIKKVSDKRMKAVENYRKKTDKQKRSFESKV